VIDALGRIAERHPDVLYLITGEGPTRAALEARARERGVVDRVIFAGRIPEGALGDLYAACDVFVMPSRRVGSNVEGFGIVALEAAAAGRPVVGGASGGVADAVEDGVTGRLVDPGSASACAEVLIDLLGDDAGRRAMGEAGRSRVCSHFDHRAFEARLLRLEREVLSGVPHRRGETRSSSRFSG
jgi:phosphatidylinositol alpha-1,6-mannosyltransferase